MTVFLISLYMHTCHLSLSLSLSSTLFQTTGDFELINYSEHGCVVDGVLYCCDFSDKKPTISATVTTWEKGGGGGGEEGRGGSAVGGTAAMTLNDLVSSAGDGLRSARAKMRLMAARRRLAGDRDRAVHAIESAIRLGSHRVSSSSSQASSGGGSGSGVKRSLDGSFAADKSTVSIPLTKTRRMAAESGRRNTINSSSSSNNTLERDSSKTVSNRLLLNSLREGSVAKSSTAELRTKNLTILPPPPPSSLSPPKAKAPLSAWSSSLLSEESFSQPCLCKGSAAVLVGTSGKGWEGTATLSHGSRLRIGCIQFIMSVAGRPGHSELVQALLDLQKSAS